MSAALRTDAAPGHNLASSRTFLRCSLPTVRTNVRGRSLIGRPPRCPGITGVSLVLAADRLEYVIAVTLY